MARVMVMMSGGVDSSVAAAALRDAGHDVTGVTLKLWGGSGDSGCCSVSDVEDARSVAAALGVPHYVFNFTDDFETQVVGPYAASYASGFTPNPCVECNRSIKFGRLLQRAVQMGYDAVATGHHARIVRHPSGRYGLARGADRAKDQSYVLAMLGQHELARTMLPVGDHTKAAVRAEAARLGLRTAAKPDSQDVCFVGRSERSSFVARRVPATPGSIVGTGGEVLGRHDGIAAFTVGQRRGLGVAVGERRYVVDVDPASATVTLGRRGDLLRDSVGLGDLRFVDRVPARGEQVRAQTRAHGDAVPASLDGATVRFETAQPRVAPGQLVALYDEAGEEVLGSGTATRVPDERAIRT